MIKQAIIPLAGLGTRLLPLTSVFAKELLPINGKPGIQYILDECIEAGIKEVVFIISKKKQMIKNYFYNDSFYKKIIKKKKDPRIIKEYKQILKYKKMIKFVYQNKPLGTGDAVLKTKKYNLKKNNVKIISCKTIRDFNKLAFSSRNKLLSKNELIKAGKISKEIFLFKKRLSENIDIKKLISDKKKELVNSFNVKFDYLELRNKFNLKASNKVKHSKLFVAYYINKVRLIDNF